MSVRQRVMSVLTLAGCVFGLVAIPLGWGATEPLRFGATAADCPDLRWPVGDVVDPRTLAAPLP